MPPAPPPRRGDGSPLRLCSSGPRHEFIIIPSEAHCSAFREMLDNQLITLQSEEGARLKHLSCFSCKNFPGVAEGKFPFMRGLQLIKSENNRTRP